MRTSQRHPSLRNLVALLVVAVLPAAPRIVASQAAPGYDHRTETVVIGFVKEIRQIGTDQNAHLHLLVAAPAGAIDVDVAPQWFVTQQQFLIAKGDRVEVTGSRMLLDGEDELLVARRMRIGKHEITVRDKRGFPTWMDR